MSVGQASGLAMAEAAARRLRGRAVHAQPGQAGGRRLRRAPTRSRCSRWCRPGSASPSRPEPADAADAAALALCHLAHGADARPRSPPRRAVAGDDRLAAGHACSSAAATARCSSRSAASATASRSRRAPLGRARRPGDDGVPLRPPPHPRGRPDAVRLPHPRRARLLRGAASAPTASARRWRWRSCRSTRPAALRRRRRRRRRRRARAWCPASARRPPRGCWSS